MKIPIWIDLEWDIGWDRYNTFKCIYIIKFMYSNGCNFRKSPTSFSFRLFVYPAMMMSSKRELRMNQPGLNGLMRDLITIVEIIWRSFRKISTSQMIKKNILYEYAFDNLVDSIKFESNKNTLLERIWWNGFQKFGSPRGHSRS